MPNANPNLTEAVNHAIKIGAERKEMLFALRDALENDEEDKALDIARKYVGLTATQNPAQDAHAGS